MYEDQVENYKQNHFHNKTVEVSCFGFHSALILMCFICKNNCSSVG